MSKFALVVFPDERRASEGIRALEELHERSRLVVYGTAVILRDEKGALSVRKHGGAPLGLGVAALVGGLAEELFGCVERELPAGKSAVIAELSDQRATPIHASVQALEGRVVWEWGDDFLAKAPQLAVPPRERPGVFARCIRHGAEEAP